MYRCKPYISLLLGLLSWGAYSAYLQPEIWIYADKDCTQLKTDASFLKVDTGLSCQTIYYTDTAGKKFPTTMGNYRCYPDKLVFDKYPVQTSCSKDGRVNQDYSITLGDCQKANSHEGPVYEKLVNYQYGGKEDCQTD